MTTNSTGVVMLGLHSKSVLEKNKQAAMDRLVKAGFKKKLVSDAFGRNPASVRNLSAQLLEKADKLSPTLLRYSAAVMMAAYYDDKKQMPVDLVHLVFAALKTEEFNRRKTKSLNAQRELVRFIVAYPNASLTVAGKYLGKLFGRPKVHVETIKRWCRVVGVDEILDRISTDDYKKVASSVNKNCAQKRMHFDLPDRDKKPSKRGIYKFLLSEN